LIPRLLWLLLGVAWLGLVSGLSLGIAGLTRLPLVSTLVSGLPLVLPGIGLLLRLLRRRLILTASEDFEGERTRDESKH
jgi:hypothetical protein